MKEKEPLIINDEFNAILDLVENHNENLFITGRAGTGKSTLLNLLKRTTNKNAVVLAPTGIAALNVGGQTIHSFFKLPPKMIDPSELKKRKNHRFFKKMKLLIIDEISMVRADVMDVIDRFLRINIEKDLPFGGVQLVVFGDLFQLPPVVSSPFEKQVLAERYECPYFFASHVVQNDIELRMIELNTVFRQKERRFINLLDSIRTKSFDYDDLEDINQRHVPQHPDEEAELGITLCSTNATVNRINNEQLNKLLSTNYEFKGKIDGRFKSNLCPAEENLWLKVGAQVMFVKNDPEGRFVNGTLGKILTLSYTKIRVEIIERGQAKTIIVERVEWEMLNYEVDQTDIEKFKTTVIGTFNQFPLKLAWAITIHKSQGKTFDRVTIDLGRGAFDFGQTYVALSRCRTREGIFLKKPITPRDIIVDPVVVDYYENKLRRW